MIDAVLVHPGAAVGEIGKLRGDRAGRLGPRELHAHAAVGPQELDTGKFHGLGIETFD